MDEISEGVSKLVPNNAKSSTEVPYKEPTDNNNLLENTALVSELQAIKTQVQFSDTASYTKSISKVIASLESNYNTKDTSVKKITNELNSLKTRRLSSAKSFEPIFNLIYEINQS